jgi:hypothetical protein
MDPIVTFCRSLDLQLQTAEHERWCDGESWAEQGLTCRCVIGDLRRALELAERRFASLPADYER